MTIIASDDIIKELSTTGTKGARIMPKREYKYSANKIAYDTKYIKEHYDRIEVRLPKGYKDEIKQYVADHNTSVNVWLKELIDKEIKKAL